MFCMRSMMLVALDSTLALSFSHAGNAGSTPAGITNQVSRKRHTRTGGREVPEFNRQP